jgi:hypothetical protein
MRLSLAVNQPDGTSRLVGRWTIEHPGLAGDSLKAELVRRFNEAVQTAGAVVSATPGAADAVTFTSQLEMDLGNDPPLTAGWKDTNFAQAHAVMHAGLDALTGLTQLPGHPAAQAVLQKMGVHSGTMPEKAKGLLRHVNMK